MAALITGGHDSASAEVEQREDRERDAQNDGEYPDRAEGVERSAHVGAEPLYAAIDQALFDLFGFADGCG